jgi:hypothetical protein
MRRDLEKNSFESKGWKFEISFDWESCGLAECRCRIVEKL